AEKEKEARRAEEAERKRAEDNFAEARDAVRHLTDIGQRRLAHEPHMELVRRELLQAALGVNQRFLARHGDRQNLRFQAALAHLRVGEIEAQLGRAGVAETAYHEAIGLLDALPAGAATERDRGLALAASWDDLALLLQARDVKKALESAGR